LSDHFGRDVESAAGADRPFAGKFAMPIALIILLLDITLIYHAAKTGRL
jgi:hypothetical protein